MKTDILEIIAKQITSASGEDISVQDLIDLINKVAYMHRNKNFGYFTEEDIETEVWIICLEQLAHFDVSKGLGTSAINSVERWLNRVVKNRLHNFYRNNCTSVNEKHCASRMNLINTLGIDNIDITRENNAKIKFNDPCEGLVFDELNNFVESKLDGDLLEIYHNCLEDEYVSSYYKSKLNTELKKIIQEWKELNSDEN